MRISNAFMEGINYILNSVITKICLTFLMSTDVVDARDGLGVGRQDGRGDLGALETRAGDVEGAGQTLLVFFFEAGSDKILQEQ